MEILAQINKKLFYISLNILVVFNHLYMNVIFLFRLCKLHCIIHIKKETKPKLK